MQRRYILELTLSLLLIAVKAFPYDFKVDGLCYNILSDNTVELTWEALNTPYTGEIVVPSSVNYSGKKYDVVAIGKSAMANVYSDNGWGSNGQLLSVSLPSTIVTIGARAFSSCYALVTIDIPNSVTSIGNSAFDSCTRLTSITIPNSVTSIGNSAFHHCGGLTSIYVSSGNTKYDSRNNCNAIIETSSNMLITGCRNTIIPNSVTNIGNSAFDGCPLLTSITIPNSVTSIGNYAFRECHDLTSITIPNSVTSIGEEAFRDCRRLTSITIPNSVTSIGESAFSDCEYLTYVTIPNSVTSIGGNAFYGTPWFDDRPDGLVYAGKVAYEYKGTMPSNTSVVLEEGTLGIGGGAFYGCTGLTSVTIPNSVMSIGNSAFSCCSGLTTIRVESGNTKYDSRNDCNAIIETGTNTLIAGCKNTTIPNTVASIGSNTFDGCSGLTSITIPNSVTSIGSSAFAYCRGLASITIPNSVTSIGGIAFYGCSGLTSIISEIQNPFDISENVFSSSTYTNATLTVLSGTKSKYQQTNYWNKFKSIVEASGSNDEWIEEIQYLKYLSIEQTERFYKRVGEFNDMLDIEEQRDYFLMKQKSFVSDITYLNDILDRCEKEAKDGTLTEAEMQELRDAYNKICKTVEEMDELYVDVYPNLKVVTLICNEGGIIKLGAKKTIENQQETIKWTTIEALKFPIEVIPNEGYYVKTILMNGNQLSGVSFLSTEIGGNLSVQFEKDNGNYINRTIHVATAGTLSSLISESEKYSIKELTLTGELNGTDFRLIRDMAGCDYLGRATEGKLRVLDISGTKVVKGGEKYLDTNRIGDRSGTFN